MKLSLKTFLIYLHDFIRQNSRKTITPLKLSRRNASQFLIHPAQARTTITSSSDLSENPKVAKENFDSLMRSRMINLNF